MDNNNLRMCVQKTLESDMTMNIVDHSNSALRAAFYKTKLWNNNDTITISFFSGNNDINYTPIKLLKKKGKIDPLEEKIRKLNPRDAVKLIIMERIQPFVGLKLKFVEANGAVRIAFIPKIGSWSLIGTDCLSTQPSKQTMNFAWLDAATVIHEFGHAIGMIHEHQNPRGNTIQWNVPKVLQWAKETQGWSKEMTMSNIINKYKNDQLNGSKFDSKSIMLYFFPASLTLNNKGTSMNIRLSYIDVLWMNKSYSNAMNIKSIYEKMYNTKVITDPTDPTNGGSSNKNNIIVILFLLALLLLFLIYNIKK